MTYPGESMRTRPERRTALFSAALCLLTFSGSASGQTWAGGETTPHLLDIAAVDETGEDDWVFGAEDLADDGLDTFQQQEQSIDVRTAYATADENRFWVRAYVSNTSAPGGNMSLYVFVDADEDEDTGGSAAASEVDDRFAADPTPGGYDYVVAVGGNEMVLGVWEYDEGAGEFVALADPETLTVPEVGTDTDPILIGSPTHGYLQFDIDLAAVDLTMGCNAELFIRSLNDTGSLGTGDLEVGGRTFCRTRDQNDNDVPDALEPVDACSADEQCPRDGICIDGSCVFPLYCRTDGDCDAGEVCGASGYCLAAPTGTDDCSDNSDCGNLVCSADGMCEVCGTDSECDDGYRCGAPGYCVDGSDGTNPTGGDGDGTSGDPEDVLNPGDKVQGGAFKCSSAGGRKNGTAPPLALLILFFALFCFSIRRTHRARSVD